jgi:hypothetical protein
MTDPKPLTAQQLDEIETRAASLHEYATLTDIPLQADADQLTGEDVGALLAEIRRLRAELEEMARLRGNSLRALYRDDVETDIDLEETIGAPFYGPGWDWDDEVLQSVVREAAEAVRPAFGKLTQQRDEARTALEQIRHLHKDSPMGPCPVCIDADAAAAGGDGLVPYPCPTARLAGAQDCEPPHVRAAAAAAEGAQR